MPGVTPDSNGNTSFEFRPSRNRDEPGRVRRTLASALRAVCFWLAIGLPFLYFPLLVHGFAGPNDPIAFGVLLVLNVVALLVGHDHRR